MTPDPADPPESLDPADPPESPDPADPPESFDPADPPESLGPPEPPMTFDFSDDSDFQGIKLAAPTIDRSESELEVFISGVFRIYVKQGSQMGVWQDFPQAIIVIASDVETGKVYKTMDISTTGTSSVGLIESYAEMPENQFVQKPFEIDLFRKLSRLPRSGTTLEIKVRYLGKESNAVRLKLPK